MATRAPSSRRSSFSRQSSSSFRRLSSSSFTRQSSFRRGSSFLRRLSSTNISNDDLEEQAFDVVCNAFANILGIDAKDVNQDTDFFAQGAGSLQVRELQDYLAADKGQDLRLRHKLEQHVLFTSPKVGDIVRLLMDLSKNAVGKSDEELLEEAKTLIKKAYSEVLGLEEDAVKDDTDFFEAGGGSMQVRVLIDFIKNDQGQDKKLQQSIEQHELFASPAMLAVAQILVAKAKQGGTEATKKEKTIESVAEELVLDHDKYYPASYAQEQTFVLNASGAGSAYNMPWIVDFQGNFNEDAMIQALDLVVKREQPLRTVLRLNPTLSLIKKRSEGKVQQRVLSIDESRDCWELTSHKAWSYEEAVEILEKEQDYIFDLSQTPISRLHIVEILGLTGPARHLVMCNSHHVHHDTGSVVTYRRHVMEAYLAINRNEKVELPKAEGTFDYVAYAVWQRQVLTPKGVTYLNQLAYWKDELDGARALSFPKDPTATPANTHGAPSGGMVTLRLEPDIASKWKQCLSSHGCTPFMGGMTLLHILLSRWFGEKDIVSGAAIANRDPHPSYADRLGCFRNVLPIRSNRAGQDNPTYLEMLTQIKTKIIQSWSAKEIPYHLVIAGMGDKSFRGFNVMYAFQDAEWHTLTYDTSDLDMDAKVAYLNKNATKFDVHLMLRWNADGGVDGDLIYSASKFGRGTMQSLADAFVIMATAVAEQGPSVIADQKMLELPMLSPDVMATVRDDWNVTSPKSPYPVSGSISATVMTAMHAHDDDGTAVLETFSGTSYTYSELRNNVSIVAAGIQSMLRKEHPRIAVVFNRGFEMYSTLLAVLSVGGCLVPIDASNTPADRVVFMIKDSETDIIIYDSSNEEFVSRLDLDGMQTITKTSYEHVVEVGTGIPEDGQANATVEADSLAYILYTSGTTGTPKGVCISHANVLNSIYWWTNLVKLDPTDKFLHFSSFSFVMSIRQIYPVFFVGATLVSPGPSSEFESAVVNGNVTKMAITPSALATLDREKCPSLKVVQVAGEACPENLASDWAKVLDEFYIGLGPTELCGHACCGKFNVGDDVRIGYPVDNAAAYILNEAGQLQPPGVIGELCIAGANVAKGYLKRDELTKKHFVTNTFDSNKPNMYKVGDLARRHSDGRIEFVGRSDDQVKVRGFRIELQEIVSAIVSSGLVAEAHVLPSEVKGVVSLTAYVKPKSAEENDLLDNVKLHLNKTLPTYMIPTHIIPMEKFPLNKNGKLDRSNLPSPVQNELENVEFEIDGEDPVVEMIVLVFAAELNLTNDEVWKAMNQSFFEIGGTSLSAVQSLRQLSEALSVDLKVMDLIRQPSLLEFIKFTLQEVKTCKESRVATAMDLNVVSGGDAAKAAGTEMNWILFRILQSLAMVSIIALSVVVPLTVAVVILLAALDVVGFPLILPLLPSIYGCMAMTNLFVTSFVMYLLPMSKTPSSYPLSSSHFLKWLVHKKMTQVTVNMFWPGNSTKVMTLVYKFLGADIGSDVTIDNAIVDIPSLVAIGKGVSIGFCTRIVCGEMRGETLFICPVELDQCVKTEPRSSITPGSSVPAGCIVRAWACVTSTLDTSTLVSAKELVGSPAVFGEDVAQVSSHVPSVTQGYCYLLCQLLIMYAVAMITFLGVGISCVFGISLVKLREGDLAQLLYFVIAGAPVAFFVLLLVIIITKRTILNRPQEGLQHTRATFYLRVWTIDTLLLSPLLSLALEYLLPPSMHHYFLQAMGGKAIGAHTFWNSPQLRAGCEHISIGEALHSGFLQIWDTQVVSSEGISFKPISIGDNCTLGQRTVVMPGCSLNERVTCGSESIILQDMVVQPNGIVVGNPPNVFVSSQSDAFAVKQLQESVTISMTERGIQRRSSTFNNDDNGSVHHSDDGSVHLFNCVAVILNLIKLPFVVGIFVAYYHLFDYALSGSIGSDQVVLRVCVSALVTYVAGILSIALLLCVATRSGLASFQSGSCGYYTPRFIAWWFFMWLNRLCSGLLLYPIHGTYLFNIWLRMVGAKVGERCFIDPGAAGWFEIDGLVIADGSFVLTPNVHGHFVDHGKLQFAFVTIGHGARINDGATVMPFAQILDDVTLLTQCTTIKGMTLDSGIYMGNVASLVKYRGEISAKQLQESLHSLHATLKEQEASEDVDDLRIVIVGQQAFGAAVLQKLLERSENVVAVCGNPTKPGEADDPLIAAAKNQGIEVYQPKSWKTPAALEKMKSFQADFCLMAYVTKYFPPEVANTPKYGSACFHPSMLPLHRGPSAISWAIAMGRNSTGVTIFEPTERLDEGPIIIQKECEIGPDDTLGDLYSKKLFPMGVDAMVETVDLVKSRQLTKQEQDLSRGSYESWFRGDAVRVDFTGGVDSVYNIIRAANPTPGADASFNGSTIKLYESRKVEDKGGEPGNVVGINDEGVLVQAEGGCILVKRVGSLDGKRLHASKWASEVGLKVGTTFDPSNV